MKKRIIIFTFLLVIIVIPVLIFIKKNGETTVLEVEEPPIPVVSHELTREEALKILQEKFDFVEEYLTDSENPCGDSSLTDDVLEYYGMPYYKSNDFHSLEELNSFLLKYMSLNIINKKETFSEDYYLEQDNNLYCLKLGEGNISYVKDKTKYELVEFDNHTIKALVTSYVEANDSNFKTFNLSKEINVALKRNDMDYQITEYEIVGWHGPKK